jgi:glycosyltransferase involved in cell wall biosynthesis
VRVVILQDALTPGGGTAIVVTRMVEALVDAGCTPTVACRDRGTWSFRGVPVYEVPELFQPSGTSGFGHLQAVIDQERPDLIHVHDVRNAGVIRLAAERLPTIVTIHVHNAYCPGGSKVFWRTDATCTRPLGVPCLIHAYAHRCAARHPVRLWRQFAFSKELMSTLQQVRRVLTLSNYVRERLLQSGLSPDRVTVLEPWVEIPPVTGSNEDGSVLFAGRLTREKGLATMLRALALVRVPFTAVIAGDGPLRRACEKLASDLSIDRSVRFCGWLSTTALREEYARSALLVVPSTWPEPFGMVGPEAMAYGKPVVAFDVGGVREWLIHEANGLLVPRGDILGLAAAITRLLTHTEFRAELGGAAREFVTKRFNQKLQVSRLVASYRELLN